MNDTTSSRSFSPAEAPLEPREVREVDPNLTRLDVTGYSLETFGGEIRIFEPPPAGQKVAELQVFVAGTSQLIAVQMNRAMLHALAASVRKALAVGDEIHKQGGW